MDLCDGCEDCQLRQTIRTDGATGHYVEIADVDGSPLRLLGSAFTVEGWVRLDGSDDYFDFGRHGSGSQGWRIWIGNNGLLATVRGQFDHLAEASLQDGIWHHVAWTYEQTSSALYVDGTLVSQQPQTESVGPTDAPVRLGVSSDSDGTLTEFRQSRADEIRVSSTIRYAGDFIPVRRHTSDEQAVGLWHFDEGAGDTIVDASPYDHPGFANGVTWEPDAGYGVFCEPGGAQQSRPPHPWGDSIASGFRRADG